MAQVLLYPKKGGAGGANKAEPWAFPERIAQKLLKQGTWASVPDVTDATVATSLVEKAQAETRKQLEEIAKERQELLAMRAQIEAMQAQLGESKKPGRPAKTEV